jgi:hypothetical protein
MSPIHDQSYRRYEGKRQPLGRGWLVIAWNGIKILLSRKVLLGLLVVGWLQFVVRTVQIYAAVAYPTTAQLIGVTPKTFLDFIEWQFLAFFLMTIYVGSGLIANDRRANALQIYLSKGIMRIEYIAGKLAILTAFLLFITLLPAVLLVVVQVSFAGNLDLLRAHPHLLPAIVLSSLVRVLLAAGTMLALSSLSKSTRYVAILYTGAIFFSEAVYGVMRIVTGSSRVAWVSFMGNLQVVTDAMFRVEPRYETPVIVSTLILLGLAVLSISVLERRVRGVEVVT